MPKTSGNRGGYEKALNSVDGDKVGKKRFKWASFNDLVGRIDVGREVHRSIGSGKVQLEPTHGAESFFQQEVRRCLPPGLCTAGRPRSTAILHACVLRLTPPRAPLPADGTLD